MLSGDPDVGVSLLDPVGNVVRLSTQANGVLALLSDANTDAEARELQFQTQIGTERGMIGYIANDDLNIINRVHGALVRIQGEDVGGVLRDIMSADPDGDSVFFGNGIAGLHATDRTVAGAQAAASLPPLMADNFLRTQLISWIAAPRSSSCAVI